ncbi:hypothetical protein [Amycolatopsis sp. FDAARGOS 1241]|uniref:hypothetical protein n=1 Tax=Amycolatopsis sp. FDAARGOS 1241 TaxID=2778070 RepID=UPI0019509B4F|nr:hypothetical protein [Amycolatopsis sp. FDAARGOS 1241]QRP48654.1 hypothetical protein I6J71_12980 [Amycolatopsis sp. FDAARGOS 1241]
MALEFSVIWFGRSKQAARLIEDFQVGAAGGAARVGTARREVRRHVVNPVALGISALGGSAGGTKLIGVLQWAGDGQGRSAA